MCVPNAEELGWDDMLESKQCLQMRLSSRVGLDFKSSSKKSLLSTLQRMSHSWTKCEVIHEECIPLSHPTVIYSPPLAVTVKPQKRSDQCLWQYWIYVHTMSLISLQPKPRMGIKTKELWDKKKQEMSRNQGSTVNPGWRIRQPWFDHPLLQDHSGRLICHSTVSRERRGCQRW